MLEDGGDGRACILVDVGDEACKETDQRVRLRPKTTEETPLLPKVLSSPVAVSGPASFAWYGRRLVDQPDSQHGLAVNKGAR